MHDDRSLFGVLLVPFLLVALLTGCENQQIPEPDLELEPVIMTADQGQATFRYTLKAEAYGFNASADDTFILWLSIEKEDPKGEALIMGSGEGLQVTKLAGGTGEGLCWITLHHKIDFDFRGVFKPSNCTFEIVVAEELKEAEIVSNECPFLPPIDPTIYYFHPPIGTHIFTRELKPLTWTPDTGVTITYTLSDVSVPESTGCQW